MATLVTQLQVALNLDIPNVLLGSFLGGGNYMLKSLFNKDNFKILQNKKLLIAITAVIFIPILYAGMFLWSFWDPYEYIDDIPIAVVNEDQGYQFEGELLQVGDELVDNMKMEDYNFNFVDKDEGYSGLRNLDYYILIEIPEDFSKNATSVIDHPQKLELIYAPNESYNFLASQMGESAMLLIQQQLEAEITKTYINTVVDKVDGVKDLLIEAKDATVELNEGAYQLDDGAKLISTNLVTLSEKMVEYVDGVGAVADGVDQLSGGTNTLSSGIQELYDNSKKLRDASVEVQSGTEQLNHGMKVANDGVKQIEQNVPALISGTDQVNLGLTTFQTELPKQMVNQIKTTVMDQKDSTRKKLNQAMMNKKDELSPVISKKLTNEIASGTAETVANEAANIVKATVADFDMNQIVASITQAIREVSDPGIAQTKQEVRAVLQAADVSDEVVDEVLTKLDPDYHMIQKMIATKVEATLNNALANIEITDVQQKQLEKIIIEKAETKVTAGVNATLDNSLVQVDQMIDNYENKLEANLDSIAKSLESEIKAALNEPIGQLQAGVNQINDGQKQLYQGVQALGNGTNDLVQGSNALHHGQSSYVYNMNQFTDAFSLANNGSNDLASGANELQTGTATLLDATTLLQDGTNQLAEGSVDLHEGTNTLLDGTKLFFKEMTSASDAANDVNVSEQTKDMFASPVDVLNTKINEVPNYGTGFAPYFLSLGLFVGALILSVVYPLRDTSSIPSNGTEWFLRKFIMLSGIGILQALVASVILLLGLGIDVQSVPLFIMFAIFTSLTFVTLIQFFVTVFDDPGRFIAILILILQLTTSAGTFPLELIPKVLQPFNTILPMTYSVAGFKAVISSGDYSKMWANAGVLVIFMTLFIVSTWIYFVIKFQKQSVQSVEEFDA